MVIKKTYISTNEIPMFWSLHLEARDEFPVSSTLSYPGQMETFAVLPVLLLAA